MNKTIAKGFYDTVVVEIINFYTKIFAGVEVSKRITDEEKRMISLYDSLNNSDKALLFDIMEQISKDTVSYVFGLIDGTCTFSVPSTEFKLYINDEDSDMGMQDSFLAYIQELNTSE